VFAWAENVSLSVLTQAEPIDLVPQSSIEYKGIVSKPASFVAKVAGSLKVIPSIAPFATATEIGARAIATMAALFGYSKPVNPEINMFQPLTRQSLADTDGKENLLRLVVDTKNELSIDPKIAGLDANDELVIHYIASKESYLKRFPWNTGTAAESLLFSVVVDPCVHVRASPELHFPACAFATFPFRFWKGTMKYRFQVVASDYHKGRLKFVYDPVSATTNAEYNTVYTQIVDIDKMKDFTIEVGWGQTTPFREHVFLNNILESSYMRVGEFPVSYSSTVDTFGNGTLSVYVVNELATPNSSLANDISINVFVSAGDDFEVGSPTDFYLTDVIMTPQSDIQHKIEDDSILVTMGPKCVADGIINKIHFGEAVLSFRSLLKRYTLHEIITPPVPATGYINFSIIRNMFPFQAGYTQYTPADSDIIATTSLGAQYALGKMTLLNYVTSAFGGWRGAIRYTTDCTNTIGDPVPGVLGSTFSVGRYAHRANGTDEVRPIDVSNINTIRADTLRANRYNTGYSGIARWTTNVNPVQSYEIPYYSEFRFAPAKFRTNFGNGSQYEDSYVISSTARTEPQHVLYQYVAAGEDFTPLFYLSPPIFYEQVIIPDFPSS